MSDDRHEAVSRRAYELWEKEGGGHGRHEDHWHQAASELEEGQGNAPAPDGTTLDSAPADQTAVNAPVAPPVKKAAKTGRAGTPADQTAVDGPAAPPARAAAAKPRKPKTTK